MKNLSIIFGLFIFIFFTQNIQAQEELNYELVDDGKEIILSNNDDVKIQFELKVEKTQCKNCAEKAKEIIQVRSLYPGEKAFWDKQNKDNCQKGKRCFTITVMEAKKQE